MQFQTSCWLLAILVALCATLRADDSAPTKKSTDDLTQSNAAGPYSKDPVLRLQYLEGFRAGVLYVFQKPRQDIQLNIENPKAHGKAWKDGFSRGIHTAIEAFKEKREQWMEARARLLYDEMWLSLHRPRLAEPRITPPPRDDPL